MPASLVWYLATEGGARAIGLENVGRLAAGWQADLQLIRVELPTPLRQHNLYDQVLLFCHATDVTGALVNGNVLMRDGILPGVDEPGLRKHAQAEAQRLWSAPKPPGTGSGRNHRLD
jgi:cytosine/adenosine deaminase-related metal-dependent hydrolase